MAQSATLVYSASLLYGVQLEALDPKQYKVFPIPYSLFPSAKRYIVYSPHCPIAHSPREGAFMSAIAESAVSCSVVVPIQK